MEETFGPDRHARQMVFPPIGEARQHKLLSACVAVMGCGGLGTHIADNLSRSGAGRLKPVLGQGQLKRGLMHIDTWENSFEVSSVQGPDENCPACGETRYEFLEVG